MMSFCSPYHIGAFGDNRSDFVSAQTTHPNLISAYGIDQSDFVSEKTTQPHSILPPSQVSAFVDSGIELTVNQVSQNVASHRAMMSFRSPHHKGAFGDNRSDFVSAQTTQPHAISAYGIDRSDFVSEKTTKPHSILPSSRVGAFVDSGIESTVNQVSQNVASHRAMMLFHSPYHIGAFGDNRLDFIGAFVYDSGGSAHPDMSFRSSRHEYLRSIAHADVNFPAMDGFIYDSNSSMHGEHSYFPFSDRTTKIQQKGKF
jgi:hypothetical protein